MFLFSVSLSQLNIVKQLRYLGCMLSVQEGMFWLGYWWTFSAFPLCHCYVICCIEIWRPMRWNSNNISEKYFICLDTFLGSPFFVRNSGNCFYSQAEWSFPSDSLLGQGRLTREAVVAVRAACGCGVRLDQDVTGIYCLSDRMLPSYDTPAVGPALLPAFGTKSSVSCK